MKQQEGLTTMVAGGSVTVFFNPENTDDFAEVRH